MNINVHHSPEYSSVPKDNLILEHYGINELNFESVKRYQEKFSNMKPNHPWSGLEIKEFLYKIGAWGKVRNTNEEGLTLAGLLMFSEERIITEVLPQYFLEYRESLEETLDEDWSKRFTSQDGTWSGNVFDFYLKTSDDLTDNLQSLPLNDYFAPNAAVYCLHESLINALVHADYYGEGGIVIEKERGLLRFSNPGLFRIPAEQAFEGNISNLRNPNLFKMFILIGLCKRTGSGLKQIKTIWTGYNEDAFDLVQDSESKRTILTLHIKDSVSEESSENTAENDPLLFPEEEELFVSDFNGIESSYNNDPDSLNNDDNSYNNGLDSVNSGNSSYNKVVYSYNNDPNSVNSEDNSYNNDLNSYNNESNSYNNEVATAVENLDSSNNSEPIIIDEKEDLMEGLSTNGDKVEDMDQVSPEEIERKIWEISELARRKKRLSLPVMEDMIIRLCAQKPLMLRELAVLLERTPDGLRNNYLAKLVDKGELRLKYPDQVNHPKQAYIIVEKKKKK